MFGAPRSTRSLIRRWNVSSVTYLRVDLRSLSSVSCSGANVRSFHWFRSVDFPPLAFRQAYSSQFLPLEQSHQRYGTSYKMVFYIDFPGVLLLL